MAAEQNNDAFAAWAASFLAQVETEAGNLSASPTADATSASPLTPAARALLAAVDAGGVPAFMTEALKRIAAEHRIAVDATTTPNDIVDALRGQCVHSATDDATKRE